MLIDINCYHKCHPIAPVKLHVNRRKLIDDGVAALVDEDTNGWDRE